MNWIDTFAVDPRKRFRLDRIDPDACLEIDDRNEAEKMLKHNRENLRELQYRLYAENRRAVLIVLQAMDAGGKDGTIRNVISAFNPQSCHVTSFKVPSTEEYAHDFLWRIHKATPSRGQIGVFNRSHYETVLVERVHSVVPRPVWEARYEQINWFEKILALNDTKILKFYLHISRDEQKKRFQRRLDDPNRGWKFTANDLKEREHWKAYQAAFQDVLTRCSTSYAPWFVIPANHKWFRNLAISQILVETLAGMNMKYPKPTVKPGSIKIA